MKQSLKQKGFTLIEVLVALFCIILILTSALSVTILSLKAAQNSRKRLIAANLAQEGIEIARANRDTNWLQEINWAYDLDRDISNSVTIDGEEFTRTIQIEIPSGYVSEDNCSRKITCTVSWDGGSRFVTYYEVLTNWYYRSPGCD